MQVEREGRVSLVLGVSGFHTYYYLHFLAQPPNSDEILAPQNLPRSGARKFRSIH